MAVQLPVKKTDMWRFSDPPNPEVAIASNEAAALDLFGAGGLAVEPQVRYGFPTFPMEVRMIRRAVVSLLALALGLPPIARADEAVSESVLTARFPDRGISALVTHHAQHDPFRRAILLLPGHPGIMKLESAESFQLKGNFLVRSRRHWLDRETVVLTVDAPSDEWGSFTGRFRASSRYAEDIRGLAQQIEAAWGRLPLVLVGTSEGSVSAYHAARALGPDNVKVIFTASLFETSSNSPGLASLDFDDFKTPMLWVHHADDPCRWTPYRQAKRHAEKTGAPLITVRASNAGRGDPCQAFSQHGFVGVERETVQAMKRWVVDGTAADVAAP